MATIIDSTGTPASESSALSIIDVTLDIRQNKMVSVLLKQYNKQSQQIKFTVTDNGEKIELKEIEHTVLFKMMTPDGRRVSSYCAINENDHTAVLTVAKNYCSYPGKGTAELEVMDALEESQVGTMNMDVIIENSVYPDEMINGSSTYQGLDEKINAVREACNSAIVVKEETESIRDETETIHDECVVLNNQTAQNTQLANDYANMAQSYANGESGTREREETDNAKYYYNQTSLLKADTETIKTELLKVQEVVNQKASAAESYATNASNSATEAENSASQTSADREVVTALANEVNNKIGSPLTASAASDMTNQNKIYVYTGSEEGYIFGNWYYYDGSTWVSGGVYNSIAFETDKDLIIADMPADAKATGVAIDSLKDDIVEIDNLLEIDIHSIAEVRTNKYIDFATGEVRSSDNYEILIFANNGYDKIVFSTGNSNNIPSAIAFYSVGTHDLSSYMKESVRAKIGYRTYVVDIPKDCKVIAISNRKSDYNANGSVGFNVKNTIEKANVNVNEIANNTDKISNCFIADKYDDSALVKNGLLYNDDSIELTDNNKYTLHISLENVRFIKYSNIYGNYKIGTKTLVGMSFYDEKRVRVESPVFTSDKQNGVIDLADFPNAKFMRFCNYNNSSPVSVTLYCETEKDAKDRKKVYVGAYYFAGWSEWELPNLHFTKDLLQTFKDRKPVWGWFSHGSYRCDAWLYSPEISISNGITQMTLTGSCVFNKDNCSINVYSDGIWNKLDVDLGDETNPEITTNIFDLSAFANKTIKLGFRIFNKNTDISPIWTINKIDIKTNGQNVFNRDFTNDSAKDFTTNDEETWRKGVPTLAYEDVNGYVGCAYDTDDTSIIDKEIILAKNKGIDYFILDWYYHNDNSTFNKEETEKEPNNLGIQVFSKSAQKYDFKYIIMIANHEGFVIDGIDNWKSAIDYINETYIKDPSYLRYNGVPVVSVFEKNKFNKVKNQINDYIVSLGYPNGWIWQVVNENTWYGYWYAQHDESVPDTEQPYSQLINDTKSKINDAYYAVHDVYPCLTSGTDLRAWKYRPGSYARHVDYCVPTVSEWKEFVQWGYDWIHAYKQGFKSVVIYAWNEIGEGGYLVPTVGDRQASFLCALEEVVNKNS